MFNVSEAADGSNVTDCLYGWEFDNSTISSSIVIDVNNLMTVLFEFILKPI